MAVRLEKVLRTRPPPYGFGDDRHIWTDAAGGLNQIANNLVRNQSFLKVATTANSGSRIRRKSADAKGNFTLSVSAPFL
jgi:hypothetical protein